jgi:hypothetical protein
VVEDDHLGAGNWRREQRCDAGAEALDGGDDHVPAGQPEQLYLRPSARRRAGQQVFA